MAVRAFIDIHKNNREPPLIELARKKLWHIIESDVEPKIKADAGEILGRLGDDRDLEVFIPIPDGIYETSVGEVTFKGFEIAKYPVTNRWYRQFIDNGGYKNPEWWSKEGKKWLEYTKAEHPRFWYDHQWNCDNHPVVGVCWWEADAFCRWLTLTHNDGYTYRLPTEQEWEAVAAGKEQRKYPWGKKYIKGRCNNHKSGIGKISAVGIFKKGETPEGIYDLSGNVWEWTYSEFNSKKLQEDFPFDEEVQCLYHEEGWGKARELYSLLASLRRYTGIDERCFEPS